MDGTFILVKVTYYYIIVCSRREVVDWALYLNIVQWTVDIERFGRDLHQLQNTQGRSMTRNVPCLHTSELCSNKVPSTTLLSPYRCGHEQPLYHKNYMPLPPQQSHLVKSELWPIQWRDLPSTHSIHFVPPTWSSRGEEKMKQPSFSTK